MFVGIQMSHMIGSKGYQVLPVITGAEQTIGYRLDDTFVARADKEGLVTSITNKVITVTYKDGSKRTVELGDIFVKSAGNVIAHEVITDLKENDAVEEGDVIAFNPLYFGRSWYNPREVFWKSGRLSRICFQEIMNAYEDSSEFSAEFASHVSAPMGHMETITLDFTERVVNLVEEGDEVDAESVLCYVDSTSGSDTRSYDDESVASLRRIANQVYTAGVRGVVSKVEIFYNGEEEDMNESILNIVRKINRKNDKLNRQLGKDEMTGRVHYGMRIGGEILGKNQICINVYMKVEVPAGIGDKFVLGNQLKTVTGGATAKSSITESGRVVDGRFMYRSSEARKVLSTPMIGTTTTLLLGMGQMFVKMVEEG